PSAPVEGIGVDLLPGSAPGSCRYNVTFAARPFDLDGFRRAVRSGADAEQVRQIVDDLQRRTRVHQAPVAEAIAGLGGRLVQQCWLINACTIEVRPEQLAAVRALGNVLYVAPDRPTYPLILTSTNAQNHNADAVQAAGIVATGFAVAINDTGQDSDMAGSG